MSTVVAMGAGCGANDPSEGGAGSVPEGEAGRLSILVSLPGGERVSGVSYDLYRTDPGSPVRQGTVNVSSATSITFTLGGLQALPGYGIVLNATSDDGLMSCTGSVGPAFVEAGIGNGMPFAVLPRQTTVVNVPLACVDVANESQGGLLIHGLVSCCPTWDTAVAFPPVISTMPPHNTTQLTGHASAPCSDDAGFSLSCVWTVISGTGTLSAQSPTDANGYTLATFTCPGPPETDIVQLHCTDGPLPDGGACPTGLSTGTTTVTCTGPGVAYSVVRQGTVNGVQQTDGIATPVFVENHTIGLATTPVTDTLVSTIALPTAASGIQQPFAYQGIAGSNANQDGAMSLSADGQYLTLAGYAAVPGTNGVVTMSPPVPRVIARIDAAGNVDTSTTLALPSDGVGGAFNGAFVRSAVSNDGAEFWVSGRGSTGGVWFVPFGEAGGGTQLTSTDTRVLTLGYGQLYGDTDPIGLQEIFTVGTGEPLAPPAAVTGLPGMPMTGAAQVSPWAFVFVDPVTLLVTTDQVGGTSPANGIQKWTLGGGTWSLRTTFNLAPGQTFQGNAIATPLGFRGLAVLATAGGSTTFTASTVEPAASPSSPVPPNHLAVFVDNGGPYDPSGTTGIGVVYAQAPASTLYRGIALSPN